MEDNKLNLFILAHQDDEFFYLPTLDKFELNGTIIIFLTDGSFYGADPAVRDTESTRVLTSIGVPKENLIFMRKEFVIKDTKLSEDLDVAFDLIIKLISGKNINTIYSLAWEGGHPDHDACFILSLALVKFLEKDSFYIVSLYNSYLRLKPFFNVMYPVNLDLKSTYFTINFLDSFRYMRAIIFYRTQYKSWLALLPFVIFRIIIQRRIILQTVTIGWKVKRPHNGQLYYEMRNWSNFQDFTKATNSFCKRHLLLSDS